MRGISYCLLLLMLLMYVPIDAQVSVNETGQPSYPGAILDVNSPSKGILVPRTVKSSVVQPAEGMIIYDTEEQCLQLYTGMQWVALVQSGDYHFWWADADQDGYGDPFNVIYAPSIPPLFVDNYDDCDDQDDNVYPTGTEVCDNKDNDCNGIVDDIVLGAGLGNFYFQDLDADGFGNNAEVIEACTLPIGYAVFGDDCDDQEASVYPGAPELCDGLDNDCNGLTDEGYCVISGVCYADGELNPEAECEVCAAYSNPSGWTFLPAGTGCSNGGTFCDGSGSCVECLSASDCVDDGLVCTIESCDAGVCNTIQAPNTCLIAGVCYNEGDPNPDFPCLVCDSNANPNGWTPLPAGTGAACPGGMICDGSGNCIECMTNGDCDDGLTCTIESCVAGVCISTLAPNTCLIAGVCYNEGDPNPDFPCLGCVSGANPNGWTPLPAGATCPGGMVCDGSGNCVECVTNGDCGDDGLTCTIESCTAGVCISILAPSTCLIDGVCYNEGDPNPGFPCLVCDSNANPNAWTPLPNGTACGSAGVCDNGVCIE